MKLTRDQFAAKCGVSKMAISKAIKRGEIVECSPGKIDTNDKRNRAYLQADHAVMKRASSAGSERVGGGISPQRRAELWEQKQEEGIRNLISRTAKDDTARARMLGLLAERLVIRNAMALFMRDWKVQIIDRMHSTVSTVYAKGQQGKPIEEAFLYVDNEVSEATEALIKSAQAVRLEDT